MSKVDLVKDITREDIGNGGNRVNFPSKLEHKLPKKFRDLYDKEKIESNEELINRIFEQKGFLSKENWDSTFDINSRVISEDKLFIFCECIIDRDQKIFEIRKFEKILFQNIRDIKIDKPIRIRILKKSGSIRIDIIDGEGFGIEKEFQELQENWNDLKELDKMISGSVKND